MLPLPFQIPPPGPGIFSCRLASAWQWPATRAGACAKHMTKSPMRHTQLKAKAPQANQAETSWANLAFAIVPDHQATHSGFQDRKLEGTSLCTCASQRQNL